MSACLNSYDNNKHKWVSVILLIFYIIVFVYRTSSWSSQGLTFVRHNDSHVECSSEHLTAFSVLIDVHGTSAKVQMIFYVTYTYGGIVTFTGVQPTILFVFYWLCHFTILFNNCSIYDYLVQVIWLHFIANSPKYCYHIIHCDLFI